jgi:hypothetical protein
MFQDVSKKVLHEKYQQRVPVTVTYFLHRAAYTFFKINRPLILESGPLILAVFPSCKISGSPKYILKQ